MPMRCPVVAVIGGGASGTLAAAHLARTAARDGGAVEILLVEPGRPGEGLAYSTRDPRHRMNVAACALSAWPDDPDHFVRWLRRTGDPGFPARGYAPRQAYGRYLRAVLDEAPAGAPRVGITHQRGRATGLTPEGSSLRLELDDGSARAVDAVVLATGHGAPSTRWAPTALRRSPRFVADPWAEPGPVPGGLPDGSDVVLVGAGLTMLDMVVQWGSPGTRVHAVSRHGLMPLPHAALPGPPVPPLTTALPAGPLSSADARRYVFAHIRAAGGDWRSAVDGLRPLTSTLWQRLDDDARREFVRSGSRRWDRVRHRVDPALYDELSARTQDGTLVCHTGEVVAARDGAASVVVRLSDGSEIAAALVVNCTGATGGLGAGGDPLGRGLLRRGLVQPDPFGLGIRTDARGRALPRRGGAPAIWALGPLRRGELWESTAIPEIRAQAAALAREVLSSHRLDSSRAAAVAVRHSSSSMVASSSSPPPW